MLNHEIALTLTGMLAGNLGAVVVKQFNIGLFWNSVVGGLGAALVGFGPKFAGFPHFDDWSLEFLAAFGTGFGLMLIAGGLTELAYRER